MKQKLIDLTYVQIDAKSVEELKTMIPTNFLWIQHCSNNYDWVSFKSALFTKEIRDNNYRLKIQNRRFLKFDIPRSLHQELRAEFPKYILVHGLNNYFQIVHLRWVLGRKVKILVQHHGERPGGFLKTVLLKFSTLFVDAFLFTSEETARQLRIPKRKLFLLMEGSTDFKPKNQTEARINLKLPQEGLIYIWVGRLIPVKNPLFLLEEFATFLKERPSAHLYLIYHDEMLLKECQKLTNGLSNVKYVGKVPHLELNDWFSAADFFLSASINEGSGYALCEAMACGCIPIVPSIGAFNFMTGNGEFGLMYEAGKQQSLKKALINSETIDRVNEKEKVLDQFTNRLSFKAIASDLRKITDLLTVADK